jgi:hypothetical protein
VKFCSSIDLSNWYFQIRVQPENEKYNTLKTRFGSFTCRVMLQEDTNAPDTAIWVFEHILGGFIGDFIWTYLDDINIYSDTFEDHIKHCRLLCQHLQDAQIYASTAKCKLFANRLTIRGHYIDKDCIHIDPEKIQGIQDWPTPKSKKELQQFIGVVIYYAQFLPHLASITAPLSELISQDVFQW